MGIFDSIANAISNNSTFLQKLLHGAVGTAAIAIPAAIGIHHAIKKKREAALSNEAKKQGGALGPSSQQDLSRAVARSIAEEKYKHLRVHGPETEPESHKEYRKRLQHLQNYGVIGSELNRGMNMLYQNAPSARDVASGAADVARHL